MPYLCVRRKTEEASAMETEVLYHIWRDEDGRSGKFLSSKSIIYISCELRQFVYTINRRVGFWFRSVLAITDLNVHQQ